MKSKFLVFLTVISMLFGIFLCNISYAEQIDTQENIDITSLENETEQVDTGSIESSSVETKEETEVINNTQQKDELDDEDITSQNNEISNEENISTKEEETSITNNDKNDVILDNLGEPEDYEKSEEIKENFDDVEENFNIKKDETIEQTDIEEKEVIIETEIIETKAPIFELNRNIISEREPMDVSSTVTSLSINKTTIEGYGDINIKLEFKDNNEIKYQRDDTIEISFGEIDKFHYEPILKENFPIKKDGEILAYANKSSSGITITFIKSVEKYDQGTVNGVFDFTATVRNDNEDAPEEINITISSGDKSKTVTVKKVESGSETDTFYYKTGSVLADDPSKIQWWLIINPPKIQHNSPVTIKDSLVGGTKYHKIDIDSIRVDISPNKNGYSYFENKYVSFNKDNLEKIKENPYNSTLSITQDSINAELSNTLVNYNTVTIYYQTDIIDPTQDKYSNDYNFTTAEKESIKGIFDVNNLLASGSITGAISKEVKIIKTLEGTKPLPGVEFKLYKLINSNAKFIETLITDEQGVASKKDLQPGYYEFIESEAPNYVDFNSKKIYNFTVKEDEEKGNTFEIDNKVKRTTINVKKRWDNFNDDEVLPTHVKIKLLGLPDEFEKLNIDTEATLSKDNDWKHTFKNLPKYSINGDLIEYSIEETEIKGFNFEDFQIDYSDLINGTFTITNKKIIEEPPTDHPITPNPEKPTIGNIRIIKKWDGKVGESVNFMLSTKDGNIFRPIELTKDNQISDDKSIWEIELSLDIRDENGNPVEFALTEEHIDGYSSDVKFNLNEDETLESIVVTNTEEKEEPKEKPKEEPREEPKEEPKEEPRDRSNKKPKDRDRDRDRDRKKDEEPKNEPVLEIEQSKPIPLVDKPKEERVKVEEKIIEEDIVEEHIEVLKEIVEEPIKQAEKEVEHKEIKLPKTGNKDYNIFYYLGFTFLILGVYLSKNNKKIK